MKSMHRQRRMRRAIIDDVLAVLEADYDIKDALQQYPTLAKEEEIIAALAYYK
jgi:uncharacterized protein (DUF433 family)